MQEDLTSDLLYKYLQDIKTRVRAGDFGRATQAILLRKTTKLGDIDDVINDLHAKSKETMSKTEKKMKELAMKEKNEKTAKAVKKLTHNRLAYDPRDTVPRSSSFHGRLDKLADGAKWEKHVT